MLSKNQNRLLTDVSRGTPMHGAFKQFWLPILRSARLEAGGAPIKVRILCEDHVAFRAHDGRVGLFAERCPHRRCSLAIAHNRDNALRCLFHGWKFDVSGKCVETPNEPDPRFPARVPLKAYSTREAGGVVWAWFGAGGTPPRFPDIVVNRLAADQVLARVARCDFNWLTGLEAILDPSHVGVLHQTWAREAPNQSYSADLERMGENLAPRIECESTPYGLRYAAIRDMPDGSTYVRVTEHIEPSTCFIAASSEDRKLIIASVPIDNESSLQWYWWYNPLGPLSERNRKFALGATDPDDDNFFQSPKTRPLWGQDRTAMTAGRSFSGFTDVMFEDFIAGEAQGAVPDRENEHVCTGDLAIIFARRQLLEKLRRFEAGEAGTFAHPASVQYGALEALSLTIPGKPVDWRGAAEQHTKLRATRFGLSATV